MSAVVSPIRADLLACAIEKLEQAERGAEADIGVVASEFQQLAQHADAVMRLAVEIAACIESDRLQQVLEKVRALGGLARGLIQQRMEATAGVLETAAGEDRLLARLAQLTEAQRSIAREARTLSVVTNIEVARLGQAGSGFQYLADELSHSSESVSRATKDLAMHTEERTASVAGMRKMLEGALPRMRENLRRAEDDLESALGDADRSLTELNSEPESFRECVRHIAAQIAGVVSAVQAQDITRQQIEHVRLALIQIAQLAEAGECREYEGPASSAQIAAGLTIQAYQLESVKRTTARWLSQIDECFQGIQRIGSAELAGIGPAVVAQERELAAQVARIEQLERDCQAGSKEVEKMLSSLTTLMELVGEYLAQAKTVRDRLQLLSFNSIVEASRLGDKAAAILEISDNVKRISSLWSRMTEESEETMREILALVEQSRQAMQAFSGECTQELGRAQAETGDGLAQLSEAAVQAGQYAQAIGEAIEKLQDRISPASAVVKRLEAGFAHLESARLDVEQMREAAGSLPRQSSASAAEIERLFGAQYTTEEERHVLRAALSGDSLPDAQPNLAGNDVELF